MGLELMKFYREMNLKAKTKKKRRLQFGTAELYAEKIINAQWQTTVTKRLVDRELDFFRILQ